MAFVKDKQKIRIQSFNGGEDSTSEPAVVKTPFASLVRGANINELGKAKQRLGPSRVGDNPATLIMDMRFHDSAATDFEDNIDSDNVTETSITYVDGKFAKAASFNGTTSLIKVLAVETEISVNTMAAFVITGQIYVGSDGEGNKGHIFDKSDSATPGGAMTKGYRAWVHSEAADTVKLSFEVGYNSTNAIVITSTTIPIETVAKIEFVHNADKSLDIRINGVTASYDTDTSGDATVVDDDAEDLYIGNTNTGDGAFDGYIEYFRIYDGARGTIEYEQDKIYGLKRFKVGSTIDRIYRIRDVHAERLDDNFLGWTSVSAAFTADTLTSMVIANDILFFLSGVQNTFSMDTSESFTDEGNTNTDVPRGTLGAWGQNNRFFVSGSLTDSERDIIWFSNTNAPQTFNRSTNRFKVPSSKAGSITWITPFKLNEIIIYKDDSIYVLDITGSTPLTDWTLQPVNVAIGCKAGRTVADIGNDQVFLDNESKVRLLSRTSFDKLETSVISGPIQSILDEINVDAMSVARSKFVNGKYYLAFPTGVNTENNVCVVWDTQAAALAGNPASGWSVVPDGIWFISEFEEFEFGDNELRLVHADNRAISMVYKHDANTDNGRIISMEVAGPNHDFDNRGTDKIFGPLHVVWESGENTLVEIFVEINEQGFESVGTFSLVGSAPVLPINLPFKLSGSEKKTELLRIKQIGRGQTCRIKAKHAQYNTSATFLEYELWSKARIPRS